MRLRPSQYKGVEKRDKLTPADLGTNVAAVLIISEVNVSNMRDDSAPGGYREVIKIGTEEFPNRWYYPNFSGVDTMIETWGPDTDEWRGRVMPLVVTQTENPRSGAKVTALHVAPKIEWRGLIDGTGEVEDAPDLTPASAPAAKKPARKSARKAK